MIINSNQEGAEESVKKLAKVLTSFREHCLLKPDQPIMHVIQVPFMTESTLPLLHRDDFLTEQVELSSFTPQNDIFLKLKSGFLLFDQHGKQLPLDI